MESALVKVLGFPATLIHGDPSVLDRWLWLRNRLPRGSHGQTLLDIGCGSGAFTIGAALRGYESLGLSWDERNQRVASERARICGAGSARFEVQDLRQLDARTDLFSRFDIAVCFETIEHILDDRKLLRDIARCLKPGGRLLLTTPNQDYKPITRGDAGPFSRVEDGWHVRKGYTEADLRALCRETGFTFDACSYCTGLLSQKIIWVQRMAAKIHPLVGWALILPARVLPPPLDPMLARLTRWPDYSICLEAHLHPGPAA